MQLVCEGSMRKRRRKKKKVARASQPAQRQRPKVVATMELSFSCFPHAPLTPDGKAVRAGQGLCMYYAETRERGVGVRIEGCEGYAWREKGVCVEGQKGKMGSAPGSRGRPGKSRCAVGDMEKKGERRPARQGTSYNALRKTFQKAFHVLALANRKSKKEKGSEKERKTKKEMGERKLGPLNNKNPTQPPFASS
ncbi:hypothetical protein GGTG_00511 [Gaeumannomyces tritici R3-111a-1]|uniref:Uncharacterized protein n=1 Tax=Gaeumannomyces tritici (strain R3-111a-1) TaxID=644352 RepID=J3NGX5_GAET3|nr:hypothetical protein GGTG_00511 [Gaeumannomyces tritici R3-111a-1]EJT80515.1 hypothetical protein GGTG_00511 [Gaeumannomyces tritici R3-111a-1]